MAGEETAFPLLPGSGDCYQSAGLEFPRLFTFADGSTAPLFTRGVVAAVELERMARLTVERISQRYGGQRLLLIQVLEGGRTFAEMVIKHLRARQGGGGDTADAAPRERLRYEVATIQVRSYGQGSSQAAAHRIVQPLRDSLGRDLQDWAAFDGVVLLDDLIDGGQTMAWLVCDYLPRFAAKSIGICTMLEKDRPRRREVEEVLSRGLISAGLKVPDAWLVGYGLDLALPGRGDQLPLHLFRQALPGGIYAFNSAIEQRLTQAYQANPPGVAQQLRAYLSPA